MACDIFSFGVILWELIECGVPWGSENPWVIVSRLRDGKRLQIHHDPKICTMASFGKYNDLMQECWKQNPRDRPLIHQVLQSLSDVE
jgi:hypothetical protein